MAENRESKTERASDRRKQEAREKGQVALSREIPTAALLLTGLGLMYALLDTGLRHLIEVMRVWLNLGNRLTVVRSEVTREMFFDWMVAFGWEISHLVLPLALGLMVVGASATVVQTGIQIPGRGIKLELSRLSPLGGLKRIFSLRAVVELFKSILKVVVIALVGFAAVRHDLDLLPALVQYDLGSVLGMLGRMMAKMAFWIGIVMAIIAAADYAYQRYEWERGLRMTKEEVKKEHKDAEGDPLLRSRVRSLQREMSRNRMMAEVPKADLVLTNPMHLAVALRYDPAKMGAPTVVAKGAGYVAERIKDLAREHGVMIVENQFIARSLYRLVEVGREIPTNLYRAVAEILALVYKARGQTTVA